MYICICKAVTDGQIRAAIQQGACTRKQLSECLSVGRDCGKCNADLRVLLNNHAKTFSTSNNGYISSIATL